MGLRKSPPLIYTRNTQLAYPRVPDLRIAAKDVDSASISRLKDLEGQLSAVGDDAQLANLNLQNALQKQQHMIQTLSNIAKKLHDSAMAAVSNLR